MILWPENTSFYPGGRGSLIYNHSPEHLNAFGHPLIPQRPEPNVLPRPKLAYGV